LREGKFYHIAVLPRRRKKPFLTVFFIHKKRLPFSGEPYRLSKPIAGILRSKSRVNRIVL
jgi:hypothetical protein